MAIVLRSHPEKCTGCRYCELICSLHHEGVSNRRKARIRVWRDGLTVDTPIVCGQGIDCDHACVEACSRGAMVIGDGLVRVIEDKCTGCGLCQKACTRGMVRLDSMAKKCDLCGGDPMCVKFCPLGALSIENTESTGEGRS